MDNVLFPSFYSPPQKVGYPVPTHSLVVPPSSSSAASSASSSSENFTLSALLELLLPPLPPSVPPLPLSKCRRLPHPTETEKKVGKHLARPPPNAKKSIRVLLAPRYIFTAGVSWTRCCLTHQFRAPFVKTGGGEEEEEEEDEEEEEEEEGGTTRE